MYFAVYTELFYLLTTILQLEKIEIAKNYLLPKQLKENGLNLELVQIPDETIQLLSKHIKWINNNSTVINIFSFIVHNFTREAGVRNLERKIGSLCRSVAVKFAMNESTNDANKIVVNVEIAKEILGVSYFS